MAIAGVEEAERGRNKCCLWTYGLGNRKKGMKLKKKVLLAANDYWTDIANCESVPVMEAEEVSKLMSKA